MWNIFNKLNQLKQLNEDVANKIVYHLYDLVDKNIEKLLVNEGADSEKIYRMLASNCDIAGLSDNQICFVKNYTYKIERINEKVYDSNLESEIELPKYYDFIISGDFYCEEFTRKLTKVIKLVIRNKIDRVDVFAAIDNLVANVDEYGKLKAKADITIRLPFKEIKIEDKNI